MPWKIKLHKKQPKNAKPGDAWPLGDAYAILLPGGAAWTADSKDWTEQTSGWTVTGEMPNITVHPSINHEGGWHGFIKDGVISDDVEGRTYD